MRARRSNAMRVAMVANAKGGCGKTTIATTLASALASLGARVAIADMDRQRGALTWLASRPSHAAAIEAYDWTRPGGATRRLATAADDGLDWLVIDSSAEPGTARRRSEIWSMIGRADFILTPVTPSVFDQRATQGFLTLAENCAGVRDGGAELLTIANRVRSRKRRGLRRELAAFFDRSGIAPTATLSDRAAYPKFSAKGLSIFDREAQRLAAMKAEWAPVLTALGAPPSRSAGKADEALIEAFAGEFAASRSDAERGDAPAFPPIAA